MVGQEAIVETLRHQVQTGRIAHAYLFCGSRGTGKTSTAKILARAINCRNPQNGDPCGTCETCRRMQSEEYMDILEFDAASNSRVEDARDLLDKVSFPPQFGAYKVYIIDEVHMLSPSAFNALLKTLEEPPEYLVFILATTEPYKLPATILSRCQRFNFGRIPAIQIQGRLREAVEEAEGTAEDEALMTIAIAAEGGMRDALSILDMCLGYGRKIDEELVRTVLGTSDLDFLFRFSDALKKEDAAETVRLIDELVNSGRDPLVFGRDISAHLRNLILAKCCGPDLAEIMNLTGENARTYCQKSEGYSYSRLLDMLDLFMKLETELRYSGTPRIALENTSLKCCLRTKEPDMLAVHDRIAELEGKISRLQAQLEEGCMTGEMKSGAGRKQIAPQAVLKEKKAERIIPETQVSLAPAGRKADDVWKDALKHLQKTEPGTHGMFLMGTYLGSDGTEYRWKANPGFEFVARSLNSPERKKKIEQALSSFAGAACTFVALDMSMEKQQTDDQSDENYLRGLRDTFGEEPVDVVDALPDPS